MRKATLVVDNPFTSNMIFDLADPRLNRDESLRPFVLLREKFANAGFDLATQDIHPSERSDIVICNEMPHPTVDLGSRSLKILLILETEVVRPSNWDIARHAQFDIIFTWNDAFLDGKKYRKINFPQCVPKDVDKYIENDRKGFCVMIAGNKSSSHANELYSKRLDTICWFEKEKPMEFDLYGLGWDKHTFHGPLPIRVLNRVSFLRKILATRRPSYRGPIEKKRDVLANYKYAICYENVQNTPGYITEKIFDCFFSGCVPIYQGPPNISNHIPNDCYISRDSFASHEELYCKLISISDSERRAYARRAANFLSSPAMVPFTADFFADSIVQAATSRLL